MPKARPPCSGAPSDRASPRGTRTTRRLLRSGAVRGLRAVRPLHAPPWRVDGAKGRTGVGRSCSGSFQWVTASPGAVASLSTRDMHVLDPHDLPRALRPAFGRAAARAHEGVF